MNEKDINLTNNTPESDISGLKDLPEVSDSLGWLQGKYNKQNTFRDMALDDVIQQRKEIPESAVNLKEQTLKEKIAKTVFTDGTGEGMNKVGEAFYSLKDGFTDSISNIIPTIANITLATKKSLGDEKAAESLKYINDWRNSKDYEKNLRDYRLGVEPEAISNEFASMIGMMGSMIAGGAVAGSAKVPAVMEGLAEGGEYLAKDIKAQAERKGGLEKYKGEGLAAATTYGTVAGLIGLKGVEVSFLENLGKFTGKQVLKGIVGEALEEGAQATTERITRDIQNKLYETDVDKMSIADEIKYVGKNMLMGALGGATFGGVAYVNNRNRMKEVLKEKVGLEDKDVKQALEYYENEISSSVRKNSDAMKNIVDENSDINKKISQISIENGASEEQVKKIQTAIRKDIIKEGMDSEKSIIDTDVFKKLNNEYTDKSIVPEDGVVEEVVKPVEDQLESYIKEKTGQVIYNEQALQPIINDLTTKLSTLEEQKASEPDNKQLQTDIEDVKFKLNELNSAIDTGVMYDVSPETISDQTKAQTQEFIDTAKENAIAVNEVNNPDAPIENQIGAALTLTDNTSKFLTEKRATSQFAETIKKRTGIDIGEVKHQVKDIKKAREYADTLVKDTPDKAFELLEKTESEIRVETGLEAGDIINAIVRKGNADEIIRLTEPQFMDITSNAGRALQSFNEKLPEWNAYKKIKDIASNTKKYYDSEIKSERNKLKDVLKIKKERLPSSIQIEKLTRELLGCK